MAEASTITMPVIGIEDLHPDLLLAAASKATGLADYGDMDFLEGFTLYLEDLRTDAGLSESGVGNIRQDILRMLSNRLGFVRDLTQHPEILDEAIERPIIITGLPRTGTTKLQRMISADPGVQRLEAWRVNFPAPFPDSAVIRPDPRIVLMEQIESVLKTQYPEMMARHPVEAREPDEEWYLMEMTFASSFSSIRTPAPRHRAWMESRSQVPVYEYLRRILQYLQWQDGGGRGRPWVLKTPAHLGNLLELFEVFHDATLVHCHRHPNSVVASAVSLLEAGHGIYCKHLDLRVIAMGFIDFFTKQLERNFSARQTLGESRIVDVYYDDIRDRPLDIISDIYDRWGRRLTPEAKSALTEWNESRPEGYKGKYRNEAERIGVDRAEIEAAFADYLRRFPRLAEHD